MTGLRPGDIRRWEYGSSSAESIPVRVACTLDDAWMVGMLGGTRVVVEAITDYSLPGAAREFEERRLLLEHLRPQIRGAVALGDLPRPGSRAALVHCIDMEYLSVDSLTVLEMRWRDAGDCPLCGSPGEWRSLALCCPYHGIFI